MTLVRKPDLAEYHLQHNVLIVTNALETLNWIAFPQSGYITRIALMAIENAPLDVATTITFELGGVLLKSGGTTATITLPNTGLRGFAFTVDIDPPSAGGNLRVEEAEEGDDITDESVLEILGGGETTTPGNYALTITVRQ
jgi:hypothetical protein